VGDILFMLAPNQQLQRVIKNRSTGSYYVASGVWTTDAMKAKIFEDLSLAFHTAHNEGLENCCVVVFRSGSREVDAQFQIG